MFNNKKILVTGGTGYFGKEFTKHIFKYYKPKSLIIFSRDEAKQYEMQQDFPKKKYKGLKFFIGDVRDYSRLNMAFKEVDYVIHAAALKHVPSAEYNPIECIRTNIYGAENIVKASIENNIEKVIALSTDKAANPINIYGATKLASDKLFIAGNNLVGKNQTRFSIVRYGNVFASRGSVVPFFRKLLVQNSKFIPVTDEKMTRFVISIDQAINFVFKSFSRMKGGEIFVPKAPSIRITDLAKAIAPNLKIKYIGIRPGEKLHEVLCPKDDARYIYDFKDHYVISPSITFFSKYNNFSKNKLNQIGKMVPVNFEYKSENNEFYLNIKQIKNLLEKTNK